MSYVEIGTMIRNSADCWLPRVPQVTGAECSSMSTRSSSGYVDARTSCLFCDNPSTSGNRLVSVCTEDTGPKIHAQAAEMQHTKLLAKMASTDFMALEE